MKNLCLFWSGIFILLFGLCGTVFGATKILLIGDSLSAGYGLSGPGWVALANVQLAEEESDIVIVNDSISGDTTAGGLSRIARSVERVAPDWVMIELGGNDGLRGLSPKVMEKNLQKMVEIALDNGARVMLLGMRIPPNYGRVYTERFEQAFVNVAAASDAALLPFFIEDVAANPALNQADQIHPNDLAQPLIRDRVIPFIKASLNIPEK